MGAATARKQAGRRRAGRRIGRILLWLLVVPLDLLLNIPIVVIVLALIVAPQVLPSFELDLRSRGLKAFGRYREAIIDSERAHSFAVESFGDGSFLAAWQLHELANVLVSQGRYADAEQAYERSLPAMEKVLGARSTSFATALANQAFLYYLEGRYADAEPGSNGRLRSAKGHSIPISSRWQIHFTISAGCTSTKGAFRKRTPYSLDVLISAKRPWDPTILLLQEHCVCAHAYFATKATLSRPRRS